MDEGYKKPQVLFIGGFPDKDIENVKGGQISACRAIISSPLSQKVLFVLLDTTQISIPPPGILKRLYNSFARLVKLIRILLFSKIDLVLIFCSGGLSFIEKGIMALISRIFGKTVILSVRSGHFMSNCKKITWRLVAKSLLKIPHVIICQGNNWVNFYKQTFDISENKCFVVPNYLDVRHNLGKTNIRPENSKFIFVFIGWIEKSKGIYDLVDAFKLAGDRLKNCELHCFGSGGEYNRIIEYVKVQGLIDKVKFWGWVEKEELMIKMKDYHALVLPTYREGFPNVIIEAMSIGLPVITTPVGAIPDYLVNNINSILIEPGEAKLLSEAMCRLTYDEELRQLLIANGFKLVNEVFDSEKAWVKMALAINAALLLKGASKMIIPNLFINGESDETINAKP
jgi:glycosyltransferase involved in cell wall biosynthesis